MTFQEYIREQLDIKEKLPFEIKSLHLKKGEKAIDIGQVEQSIFFVVSGKLESCMIAHTTEKIIEFIFPGDLFSSTTSLLIQKPSDVYTTCLANCELQFISYPQLLETCKTSLTANKVYVHFLEFVYLTRVKKEKDAFSKTIDQRYLELLKNRPQIIKEIPLGHIAKYLGVHPNSLSRIRKNLVVNRK